MQLTSQYQLTLWSLEALVLSEKDLQEKECLGKGGKQREERWRREVEEIERWRWEGGGEVEVEGISSVG